MQLRNPYLDRLVSQENYEELVLALTPKQLTVVALLLEGISQSAIAELFGVDRRNIHMRLTSAVIRLTRDCPRLVPAGVGYRSRGIPSIARGGGLVVTDGFDKE